jgi:hypothetical protein
MLFFLNGKDSVNFILYSIHKERNICLFFESNGEEKTSNERVYIHIFVQELIKAMVSEGAWHSTAII